MGGPCSDMNWGSASIKPPIRLLPLEGSVTVGCPDPLEALEKAETPTPEKHLSDSTSGALVSVRRSVDRRRESVQGSTEDPRVPSR